MREGDDDELRVGNDGRPLLLPYLLKKYRQHMRRISIYMLIHYGDNIRKISI